MDVKPTKTRVLLFSYDSSASQPKRDLLLCVARHTAVTLPRKAPLSKAQCPGSSGSVTEPSGVFSLSRVCRSSSRSLGPCLRWGQRSRMNLCSPSIRALLPQDHRAPHPEFSCPRDEGTPRSPSARRGSGTGAAKLPERAVLSERRPRGRAELTAQPPLSRGRERSALGSLSRGVLGGDQAQKPGQVADVFKRSPLPAPGQQRPGHPPADPTNRPPILAALRQFRVGRAETAHLLGRLKDRRFSNRQAVAPLLPLKASAPRAGQLSQLSLPPARPRAAGRSGRKGAPVEEQPRF